MRSFPIAAFTIFMLLAVGYTLDLDHQDKFKTIKHVADLCVVFQVSLDNCSCGIFTMDFSRFPPKLLLNASTA